MNSWLVWAVLVIACVLLGFVGYHFAVRTLRFFAAAFAVVVIVLVTRSGVPHFAGADANLVNSFTRGFDDLSVAILRPLLGRNVPPPGRIGWLVLIVALVFGYRELEVWAMRWQPPTVDTSRLGGDQGKQKSDAPGGSDQGAKYDGLHDQLCAELGFRLPAVAVRAPSVLPGGTKANELASIAVNTGISGSGLAGAIISFFSMLWPSPRRYQVRVWIEPGKRSERGKKHATADTRVTVDLECLPSGASIATKTLVTSDFDEAASAVAGYVARHIFSEDPTAPPWCVGSGDGDDLAAMLIAGRQRVSPGSPGDVCRARQKQIRILERCKLDAGVARYELAQLYDLEGNHVKSLGLHAMNQEDYPRFYRGRYRLGMSLEMIANPEFPLLDTPVTDMLASLHVLDRCQLTAGAENIYQNIVSGPWPPESNESQLAALRNMLLVAAQDELGEVRQQLTLWRVVWEMLWHRDERAIRKLYWRLRERQSFADGARVAELLVAVRRKLAAEKKPGPELKDSLQIEDYISAAGPHKSAAKIVAAVTRDDVKAKRTRWRPGQCRTPSWQAAYNTACLYAALRQHHLAGTEEEGEANEYMAEQVVDSLTRAFNDPDCEMERPWDWISADPDFSCLRSSTGFQTFRASQRQLDYPADTKACVFCGRPDADIKITREYTFPDWINDLLPRAAEKPDIKCKRSTLRDPRPVTTWTAAPDQAYRAVCQPCDARWITPLEGDVQRLLAPMIRADSASARLTRQDQLKVATWAALKAAIFEYVWTDDPVLTGKDRAIIRTQNRPPRSVQVRLAVRRPGSYRLRAHGHVYELGGQGDKALCLTMTIGCLVAQVFREPGAGTQAFWSLSKPDTGIITIFPPQPEPVPWPPPNQLDEERLQTLEDSPPMPPATTIAPGSAGAAHPARPSLRLLDADPGAEFGALADLAHDARGGDVEHVHGQALLVGQHERAGVHDPDPGRQRLVVGQRGVAHRVRIQVRVAVVDPVHPALGHQQRIGVQFQGPLHRRVVGGHVRLPDAAREQHDQAAFQVVQGPEPDERLGDAVDRHRGHHPDVGVGPGRERAPQHQRVHDGAEHPDVVRLGPADAPALGHPAAEVVPAADDDRHLHAQIVYGENFLGDAGQASRIDPGAARPRERLAAQLDENPAIARHSLTDPRPGRPARRLRSRYRMPGRHRPRPPAPAPVTEHFYRTAVPRAPAQVLPAVPDS